MFSAGQYAAWLLVALIAGITLVRTLDWQGSASRMLRRYLGLQLGYAAILLPLSFRITPRQFCAIYAVVSCVDYWAQLFVVARIAQELKGRFHQFGRLRYWALGLGLVTIFISYRSILHTPAHGWIGTWQQIDQILYIGRTFGVAGVGFYGWILASCWPRRTLLIWSGMAVQGGMDFVSSRLDALSRFAYHGIFQQVSTAGFFIAAALWCLARNPDVHAISEIHLRELDDETGDGAGPCPGLVVGCGSDVPEEIGAAITEEPNAQAI